MNSFPVTAENGLITPLSIVQIIISVCCSILFCIEFSSAGWFYYTILVSNTYYQKYSL